MIKLYIYRKSDGLFLYEDVGSTDSVIHDIDDTKDFTLTAPPGNESQYMWQEDRWVRADQQTNNTPPSGGFFTFK